MACQPAAVHARVAGWTDTRATAQHFYDAGARAGMVAVDATTIEYVQNRPYAPRGEMLDRAIESWQQLHSDTDAVFDKVVHIDAAAIKPQVTWGTSPEMVVAIDATIPDPDTVEDRVKADGMRKALAYMGLEAGTPITAVTVDKVFIGSCTNSRIEDLRAAARVAQGRKVADNIKLAMVVPGSGLVKQQAEAEGDHPGMAYGEARLPAPDPHHLGAEKQDRQSDGGVQRWARDTGVAQGGDGQIRAFQPQGR